MTPAKRRPATPASQGQARVAPDVPIAPPDAPVSDELVTPAVPPAETEDSTELLGPDGEPIAPEAPKRDPGRGAGPRKQPGRVPPSDQATTESPTQTPRRPLSLYPLPVWPD